MKRPVENALKLSALNLLIGILIYICATGCSNDKTDTGSSLIPSAPGNLTTTAVSATEIVLGWVDNSPNELGFKIESRQGGTGAYQQTAITSTSYFTITALAPAATYYFRVRAFNDWSDSAYSNEASTTTYNDWVEIAGGELHTIGRRADGTVWAWGSNAYGQLGTGAGDTADKTLPVQIPTVITAFLRTACGNSYTMLLVDNGILWACGRNDFGQLGLGNTLDKPLLVRSGFAMDWNSVACGGAHNAAIKNDKTLWTWGRNDTGQLGINNRLDQPAAVEVVTDTDWADVICGGAHTVMTKTDNSMWACGYNYYGQLGLGDTLDRLVPVLVTTTAWVSIACGANHTVGVKADGTLWAWGNNTYGQLGLGDAVNRSVPTRVGANSNWKKVACGAYHTVAITADGAITATGGTLWAWGNNTYGQLGLGDTVSRSVPTMIDSGYGLWSSVACGANHTLAIRATDNALYSCGQNSSGQLGLGDSIYKSSLSPVIRR